MASDAKFKKAYVEGHLPKFKLNEIKEYLDYKRIRYKENLEKQDLINYVKDDLDHVIS